MLGLTPHESVLPGTLSDLHIIAWKFIILVMDSLEVQDDSTVRSGFWVVH